MESSRIWKSLGILAVAGAIYYAGRIGPDLDFFSDARAQGDAKATAVKALPDRDVY